MLLNLYLFTFVQSKAFILPFCIYEPLAHEAIFFYTAMYMAFPSHPKELRTMYCVDWFCFLFPPKYHHIGVCCHLHCFGSNKKVLYEKPKELGHMRT